MSLDDPVNWINGLGSLTVDEKKAILEDNAARLLGL
jgi:predicted TIM-barrel fold metal-dependent hydrolase